MTCGSFFLKDFFYWHVSSPSPFKFSFFSSFLLSSVLPFFFFSLHHPLFPFLCHVEMKRYICSTFHRVHRYYTDLGRCVTLVQCRKYRYSDQRQKGQFMYNFWSVFLFLCLLSCNEKFAKTNNCFVPIYLFKKFDFTVWCAVCFL